MGTAADLANAFRYMRDATPAQNKEIALGFRQSSSAAIQATPCATVAASSALTRKQPARQSKCCTASPAAHPRLWPALWPVAFRACWPLAPKKPSRHATNCAGKAWTRTRAARRALFKAQGSRWLHCPQQERRSRARLPFTQQAAGWLHGAAGPDARDSAKRWLRRDKGLGYDPLDPVGLAVSALIPAGFAAYGLRQAKIAQAVRDFPICRRVPMVRPHPLPMRCPVRTVAGRPSRQALPAGSGRRSARAVSGRRSGSSEARCRHGRREQARHRACPSRRPDGARGAGAGCGCGAGACCALAGWRVCSLPCRPRPLRQTWRLRGLSRCRLTWRAARSQRWRGRSSARAYIPSRC